MYRFLLLPLLFVTACADSGPGDCPVDLDRLAPAVAEVYLAESLASEAPILVRDSLRQVYYRRTLADRDLTPSAFDSLLFIVRREPEWIDTLYSRAGVILTRAQAEATQRTREGRGNDGSRISGADAGAARN